MWKLASKSIKESIKSKGEEEAGTKPRTVLSDSSGNERKTRKEEKLECPICWESFNVYENVPYVLWCGHTICKYCLLGLQRAVVIKSSALPFQLPFFVACPWCNILSLRLVCNGNIRFPSKNFYLLWMVESKNGCRSESRGDNKEVTSGQRDVRKKCDGVSNTAADDDQFLDSRRWWNDLTRGFIRTGICKSMAIVARLLAKFHFVVLFLLMALYAIPASAAVLGIYFFVTFALAVPSFLVLYFAFPSLNWLIREIAA